MLFERDICLRHDWETVLTPVTDSLLARDDVDPDRMALYGLSQAGYWVARALAFEHRYAAAITDGGVVDIAHSWFAQLDRHALELYLQDKNLFDEQMEKVLGRGGEQQQLWEFRARPYGTGYSAVLDAVLQFTVTDVADRIATPMLILDPDGEQLFPGQPAELAALVSGSTRLRFTQDEGASHHTQPLAHELTEQRMFDWLDDQLQLTDRTSADDGHRPTAH